MKQINKVLQQVKRCLSCLVGSSGHLGSYYLYDDTFHLTRVEHLDGDESRYYFAAMADYESEFISYDPDSPESFFPPKPIEGSLVLDSRYELVHDSQGRVKIEPWNCMLGSYEKYNQINNGSTIRNEDHTKIDNGILSNAEIDILMNALNDDPPSVD